MQKNRGAVPVMAKKLQCLPLLFLARLFCRFSAALVRYT
jgi:hypothetical protein